VRCPARPDPTTRQAGAMPRRQPQVVPFRRTDVTPVVAVMEEVAAAKGWLTLQPAVATEDAAAYGRQPTVFSGHGPAVPVCTWVPGERTRRGDEYVAVGIEHAAG